MEENTSLGYRLVLSVALIIVGCGLLIAGFAAPPLGIIDNSVLVAFGEVLTFVGAILGIDYNYQYKMSKDKLSNKMSTKPKAKKKTK